MQFSVGEVVEGKVKGIAVFGAFVELPDGQTGLVHISEVSGEYVKDIKDHIAENQVVQVKILSIEPKGKISLSIRKALPQADPAIAAGEGGDFTRGPRMNRGGRYGGGGGGGGSGGYGGGYGGGGGHNNGKMSFEDHLSKFIKESEEKQSDLRRNFESKRGGGYRR